MHVSLCKNCTHTFEGNFCANCGQKTNTKRLDWQYVYDELKYTFLHVNNGLLFTAKQLYIRPGYMVREFIEGKRVKHYKPILMVFVLAGIMGLALHYIKLENLISDYNTGSPEVTVKTFRWISAHYTIVELLLLPIISLASWITFRKWGYNYIENVIINSFATSQRLLFSIATFPILYLLQEKSIYLKNIIQLPEYLLTIWLYWQLYHDKSIKQRIVRLFLFGVAVLFIFLTAIILGVVGYLAYEKLVKVT
jgi:hypothetical protein